jgi:hypothetical protein
MINITTKHLKIPCAGSMRLLWALVLTIPTLVHAAGPHEISWYTIDGGSGTSTGGSCILTRKSGQRCHLTESSGGRPSFL